MHFLARFRMQFFDRDRRHKCNTGVSIRRCGLESLRRTLYDPKIFAMAPSIPERAMINPMMRTKHPFLLVE